MFEREVSTEMLLLLLCCVLFFPCKRINYKETIPVVILCTKIKKNVNNENEICSSVRFTTRFYLFGSRQSSEYFN
jgi:hypothetical protein